MKKKVFFVVFTLVFLFIINWFFRDSFFGRDNVSVVDKKFYDPVSIRYKVSSIRLIVMEDEGFSVVFLDRDFTDPFEESWWTFFKKNRVEDFKHTTKSHPLYYFVKNYVYRNENIKYCKVGANIIFEFNRLNDEVYTVFCLNENNDQIKFEGQNLMLNQDEKILYNLLSNGLMADKYRWE